MTAPARILHLHSTFALGGKEARATRLMHLMGDRARHTILSAVPDALDARAAIDPAIAVEFPAHPELHGKPAPGRYWQLARFMAGFDLILSYNWGSMDGVMAHRMLSPVMRLPPLIHHEDGFNADEATRRNPKRTLFRRHALPTARAVMVPSRVLAGIADAEWRVPAERVALIPNGIVTARYCEPPAPAGIPGFTRRPGEVVVGTIAGLRAVKDLPALVRAVARLPDWVRLVIVGDGPERERIRFEAEASGMQRRLLMPGFLSDPARIVGHFDVLALSSKSEQQPIAVLEGMAAGLPIASPAVGDVATMVSAPNAPFIGPDLAGALDRLVHAPDLRASIGAANRAHVAAHYDEARMVADYERLYGIPGLFGDA